VPTPTDTLAELSLTDWWPLRGALLLVLAAAVALLVWWRRRRVLRVVVGGVTAVVLTANVLAGVNAYYGYYLTVGQAVGLPGRNAMSLAELDRHSPPPAGVVVGIDVPVSRSRFTARTTRIYVPPAWFARPRPHLPVLVLLHGTPGSPTDWIDGGRATATLDEWATSHHGQTPIVVMPDVNGGLTDDSECVNGPVGNVETYLTVDLPGFVSSRFFTQPPGPAWAVAGLSEGGTCALMLALRHPDLFRTFADYSGLAGPRSGDGNAVGDTVPALFGGSERDFQAHEPAYLLAHQRYPQLAGWFEVGGDDEQPLLAQQRLAAAARHARVRVREVVVPGQSHTFTLWSAALAQSLPWLVAHLGPPAPPPAACHSRWLKVLRPMPYPTVPADCR
jgi:S-formylglutathione hydrolase FrmB